MPRKHGIDDLRHDRFFVAEYAAKQWAAFAESRDEIAGEDLPDIGHFQVCTIKTLYQEVDGFDHSSQGGCSQKGTRDSVSATTAFLDVHHQQCPGRMGIAVDPFATCWDEHVPEEIQSRQQGKAGNDCQGCQNYGKQGYETHDIRLFLSVTHVASLQQVVFHIQDNPAWKVVFPVGTLSISPHS